MRFELTQQDPLPQSIDGRRKLGMMLGCKKCKAIDSNADSGIRTASGAFGQAPLSSGCSGTRRRASSRSSAAQKMVCGACGRAHRTWYDRRTRRTRDLPCGDTRIYLELGIESGEINTRRRPSQVGESFEAFFVAIAELPMLTSCVSA